MTEYDVPIENKSRAFPDAKGAECSWDPDEILQKEFDKDADKLRQIQIEMFGEAYEPEAVESSSSKNIYELTEEQTKTRVQSFVTNQERGILGVQGVNNVFKIKEKQKFQRELKI